MPGRFFLERSAPELTKAVGGGDWQSDYAPRRNIAPGQNILTCTDQGPKWMRWGMIPVGRKNARGRPVMETITNARSETVFDKSAFDGVRRCVVPADGWYEWTGAARRKTAWRIAPRDQELLYFAAIFDVWSGPGGIEVPQVATVTCAPSADVKDIHHRMGVLLSATDVPQWLGPDMEQAAALMRPWPDGRLDVRSADDVNWDAA
ncbi:MAG: SOS response-associated peptidase [Pseudomonadota bacterium]